MNWKTKKFNLVQCVGKSTIRTTKNLETDHYNTERVLGLDSGRIENLSSRIENLLSRIENF